MTKEQEQALAERILASTLGWLTRVVPTLDAEIRVLLREALPLLVHEDAEERAAAVKRIVELCFLPSRRSVRLTIRPGALVLRLTIRPGVLVLHAGMLRSFCQERTRSGRSLSGRLVAAGRSAVGREV